MWNECRDIIFYSAKAKAATMRDNARNVRNDQEESKALCITTAKTIKLNYSEKDQHS